MVCGKEEAVEERRKQRSAAEWSGLRHKIGTEDWSAAEFKKKHGRQPSSNQFSTSPSSRDTSAVLALQQSASGSVCMLVRFIVREGGRDTYIRGA